MLAIETDINIRFSDTDAMGVVWHGNYLRFFEDGREAFGEAHGLAYLTMYHAGYFTPIVRSEIDHKAAIYYGDEVKLITTFVPQRGAKLVFEFKLVGKNTDVVYAVGKTIQVFLNAETRQLELNNPPFYEEWKLKNL